MVLPIRVTIKRKRLVCNTALHFKKGLFNDRKLQALHFLLEIVDTLFDFAVAENLVLFIRANDQLYMLYNHVVNFVV